MREITEDLKVGDKVVTRDGRDGRVICTDRKGDFPIVCAIIMGDGDERIISYQKRGTSELCTYHNNPFSLEFCSQYDIFLPPKTIMLDLYEINRNGNIHYKAIPSGDSAVGTGTITYIKTIETEIE